MTIRPFPILASVAAMAVATMVAAHHSSAMFDPTKQVTLTGTVKEVQWTNPHAWIELMVPDGSANAVQWSVELDGPNSLVRQGWKPSTVATGDRVTVVAHPLRDGRPGAAYVAIQLPDGRRLGNQAALPAR